MSQQKQISRQICRRAAYLLLHNPAKHGKVVSDRSKAMIAERELLTRCYRISC